MANPVLFGIRCFDVSMITEQLSPCRHQHHHWFWFMTCIHPFSLPPVCARTCVHVPVGPLQFDVISLHLILSSNWSPSPRTLCSYTSNLQSVCIPIFHEHTQTIPHNISFFFQLVEQLYASSSSKFYPFL